MEFSNMHPAQRQRFIRGLIAERKSVSIRELNHIVTASPSTIRRDLRELAQLGDIRLVHGGAELVEDGREAPILLRSSDQAQQKQRIGEAAAGLVSDHETILISGGTTTEAMLPFLANKTQITVVTNAINIAHHLSRYSQIDVIVLGGWMRHSELTLLGYLTELGLGDLHVGKAFHGIYGLSAEHGLTGVNPPDVQTDRQLLSAATEVILLADHTKFGRTGSVRLAPVEKMAVLVTDTETSAEQVESLRARGIRVIQA